MKDEALLDTIADTLQKVAAEKIGDTLRYLESQGPVNSLADTLARVEAETVSKTLNEVEAGVP